MYAFLLTFVSNLSPLSLLRHSTVCVCVCVRVCMCVVSRGGYICVCGLLVHALYVHLRTCPFPPLPLFRVVPYRKLNLSDYYTVSLDGVTRFIDGHEAEFVELGTWVREYQNFKWLRKMKTFSKFFVWKAFSSWRRNVKWK